jgi:hypothetical protein
MRHRIARPFTVEVKSRRRPFPQVFAAVRDLDSRTDKQQAFGLSSKGELGTNWSVYAASIQPINKPSITVSASEIQAKAQAGEQPARRILPDLSWQEPVDELLRERAEEQATRRRQPRGPRKRSTTPAPDEIASRRPEQEDIRCKPAMEKSAGAYENPVGAADRDTPIPTASKRSASRVARQPTATLLLRRSSRARARRRGLRWGRLRWADRAAYRRAQRRGRPVRLRAGERWKRRLSRACG